MFVTCRNVLLYMYLYLYVHTPNVLTMITSIYCVVLCVYGFSFYSLFTAIEKKKVYLYEMQVRPWNSRKNNSLSAYMDLNHTVSVIKQCIYIYIYLILTW